MIVSIHQPNYIPWMGYFYKILKSETFVFLDDVQYIKNSYINRNMVKTPQGSCWLTLPVKYKGNLGKKINEIEINNNLDWKQKHLKIIEFNYKKAPFFNKYFKELIEIYDNHYIYLSDLNISLITYFLNELGINIRLVKSSQMDTRGKSTERLIDICNRLEATVYLSGAGGEKYQDPKLFEANKLKLDYVNFVHPEYNQLWGKFIPNMSILDFMFNCGDECREILKNSKE